jgi:Pterin binding enzyme
MPGVVSVDTFYADVAREAVRAGAHIVNDVTAGQGDREMLRTVWTLVGTFAVWLCFEPEQPVARENCALHFIISESSPILQYHACQCAFCSTVEAPAKFSAEDS